MIIRIIIAVFIVVAYISFLIPTIRWVWQQHKEYWKDK